ncbi:Tripartite tricarboxylate transporter TctB family protein [Chelatococcus asaccharovorans]|nr:Tripartite tricarboxylate transporter TctB family protein [Chelatococcus asaccharovorans]CAH1691867.1 Tripartite tricarboxylate transporter TctB family protein [Chelatococcus asaccharovorans]
MPGVTGEDTLKRMLAMPDIGAGLFFIAAGMAGLWFGRGYALGSLAQMGPGFFPKVISAVLIGIGVTVAIRARHSEAADLFGNWPWRALVLIPAALILFGLFVPTFGIIPATLSLIILSGYASREARFGELLVLAVALTAFSILVFVYGLGLGFRILPWD